MLIDSHCHLQFNAYAEDAEMLIKKTLAEGVFMIVVGAQKLSSQKAIQLTERYDGIWAAVGLHPNHLVAQTHIDESELSAVDQLINAEIFDSEYYRALAQHPKCVAIGECGLDYYHLPENINQDEVITQQKDIVRAHFDLADELKLPVIVHCRDAYQDQIKLLQEYVGAGKLARCGVVHCFGGSLEEAEEFIQLGFKIGFTGTITFPPRKNDVLIDGLTPVQHIVREIPLQHLLIETDAPYLTPVPYRGKRNEPLYVKFVAEKIAEIKNISFVEVEDTTFKNAEQLFGLKIPHFFESGGLS